MTEEAEQPSRNLSFSRGLVRWLDEYYLDGLVGLVIPGAGDVVTGVGSMTLLFTALREGVPTVILMRMVLNIVVDVMVGVIPFLGDIFDFVWRSNRRNLELIERYRGGKEEPTGADYVVAFFGLGLAALAIAIPFWWMYTTYSTLTSWFG
ncbi:MAG: DUF4112 domain-containing protein [Myxococcota bacterium]